MLQLIIGVAFLGRTKGGGLGDAWVGEKWQFDGARERAVELPLRSPAAQAGG